LILDFPAIKPASISSGFETKASNNPTTLPIPTFSPRKSSKISKPNKSKLTSSLKSFSKYCSLAAIVAGTAVLFGWTFEVDVLRSVLPGFATMKANTAAAFVLSGIALLLFQPEQPEYRGRPVAHLLAVVVASIGLLTLTEYVSGYDIGIDQLLFKDPLIPESLYPGRMPPATALNFVILGVALITFHWDTARGNRPAEWFILLAVLSSIIPIIGYIYSVQSLYHAAGYASVALHTALLFLILSAGMLCARPDRGLMALFSGESLGGLMIRRLLPAGIVALIALGWLRLAGQRAGLYDTEFGLSISVAAAMIILTLLIWLNAHSLNRAEARIIRASRLYAVVSHISQSIVRIDERDGLFNEVCRIPVHHGLFKAAWIALIEESTQSVKPVAHNGTGGAVSKALVSLYRESTAHVAIREGRYFICNDIHEDPSLLLWSGEAEKRGYRSFAVFPIRMEGRVIGIFNIYADETDFFTEEEVKLLTEIADDVSFFVTTIEQESRRKSAEQALQESEARKGAILDAALDCIISIDHEGKVIEFNPAAEQTFGYDRQETIGKPMADLIIPAALRDRHRRGLARYFATGEGPILNKRIELTAMRVDGTEFPIEITVTRISRQGPPLFTAYIRDLTMQKAQEESHRRSRELEEQNLRIQEANRLKSEFLANMSHELRTPLNGIIGFSELIVDERAGPLNADQKEYLADVLTSARHLLQLINDILDLTKIEAGKMELSPETFAIKEVITEVCTIIQPMASRKNITMSAETPPQTVLVTIDPVKFKQVLYNLLSNAVKFTPENGVIKINASLEEHERIRVEVNDTGIGIKAEDMPRLFHEFEQLDSGLGRKQQGTGLGLALTKKIVELQEGSITVESEPGKGSTFRVQIPMNS
jgi:PAS domain S-box-containing protein